MCKYETKFCINDIVFFLFEKDIHTGIIKSITIAGEQEISYNVGGIDWEEEQLFKNKEQLIKHYLL